MAKDYMHDLASMASSTKPLALCKQSEYTECRLMYRSCKGFGIMHKLTLNAQNCVNWPFS